MKRISTIGIGSILIVFFIVLYFLNTKGVVPNRDVSWLVSENILLAIIGFFAIWLTQRGLKSGDSYSILNSVYIVTFLKLLSVAIIACSYIYIYNKDRNNATVWIMLILYLVYSAFVTTASITQNNKVP